MRHHIQHNMLQIPPNTAGVAIIISAGYPPKVAQYCCSATFAKFAFPSSWFWQVPHTFEDEFKKVRKLFIK